jgi:hypothetical protein
MNNVAINNINYVCRQLLTNYEVLQGSVDVDTQLNKRNTVYYLYYNGCEAKIEIIARILLLRHT